MNALGNAMFMPPEKAYAEYQAGQLSLNDYCALGVPLECKLGWIPLLGLPWFLSQRCREADDLQKACNAGGFNRNILAGSGAGPAPPLAAQPGVNYNDPAVLAAIAEGQRRSDAEEWQRTIDANRRLMSGAAGDDDPPDDGEFPWGLVLVGIAGVVLIVAVTR